MAKEKISMWALLGAFFLTMLNILLAYVGISVPLLGIPTALAAFFGVLAYGYEKEKFHFRSKLDIFLLLAIAVLFSIGVFGGVVLGYGPFLAASGLSPFVSGMSYLAIGLLVGALATAVVAFARSS